MEKITSIISKNGDRWDGQVLEYPHITIIQADTLSKARVFLEILAFEELGSVFIKKEVINYE